MFINVVVVVSCKMYFIIKKRFLYVAKNCHLTLEYNYRTRHAEMLPPCEHVGTISKNNEGLEISQKNGS